MTKLRIGAITYDVTESVMQDCGCIDYEKQTILIRKGLAADARNVTLWHEILHGILYNMGQVNHDETIVDGLAHGIVQALNDNPHLRGKRNG